MIKVRSAIFSSGPWVNKKKPVASGVCASGATGGQPGSRSGAGGGRSSGPRKGRTIFHFAVHDPNLSFYVGGIIPNIDSMVAIAEPPLLIYL
jgi:hypothetical protein